jgi:hypothetical protein
VQTKKIDTTSKAIEPKVLSVTIQNPKEKKKEVKEKQQIKPKPQIKKKVEKRVKKKIFIPKKRLKPLLDKKEIPPKLDKKVSEQKKTYRKKRIQSLEKSKKNSYVIRKL